MHRKDQENIIQHMSIYNVILPSLKYFSLFPLYIYFIVNTGLFYFISNLFIFTIEVTITVKLLENTT